MLTGLKRKILVGVAAVAVGGGAVAIGTMAPASGASTPSSVTIAYSHGAFRGRVTSAQHACQGGRTVEIFRHAGHNEILQGTDTTDGAGHYRVPKANAGGHYSAVVTRKKLPGYAAGACKRGSSGEIVVH